MSEQEPVDWPLRKKWARQIIRKQSSKHSKKFTINKLVKWKKKQLLDKKCIDLSFREERQLNWAVRDALVTAGAFCSCDFNDDTVIVMSEEIRSRL